MSNAFAKCISTTCNRYDDCLRAKSTNNAEVNYYYYCLNDGYSWYIEQPKEVNVREDGQ